MILTELADGIEDPRPAILEFRRFLEQLKGWVDGPPVIEHLDVAGSYNLFGTERAESAVRTDQSLAHSNKHVMDTQVGLDNRHKSRPIVVSPSGGSPRCV